MTKQEFETLLEERMHDIPKYTSYGYGFKNAAEWAFELLNHIPDTEKKVICECRDISNGYCVDCGKVIDR